MSPQAATGRAIDEVLARMDRNIDRCTLEQSRLGYFAVLYRGVTARVREGIAAGEFEDPARMERLVVIFANRYLDALAQFWDGKRPARSWLITFESSALARPIVLQHLLLGMNAHINLDLAIAAAQAAPGAELAKLERDFERITSILKHRIEETQERIKQISPWFWLIDYAGGRRDEELVGFGIRQARELAWKAAHSLAASDASVFDAQVTLHDEIVAALAERIRSPGRLLGIALQIVRVRESSDVRKVMSALRGSGV
jgi:hypothetical protein